MKLPLLAKILIAGIAGSMTALWVFTKADVKKDAEYDMLTLDNEPLPGSGGMGFRAYVRDVYYNGTFDERAEVGAWLRAHGYDEAARHFP